MPFSTYMRSEIGHAEIEPKHALEAGSHALLTITYTAGTFGIDDTGAIKISWRTASDSAKPQFADPRAPNYTTAYATNGADLVLESNRNNLRPWVNTLFIRVGCGFLRAGEQIVVRLGDRSQGSPGYRLQTDLAHAGIRIAEIGLEDHIVDAGGLGRRLRLFRLPDENPCWSLRVAQKVALQTGDNPLYVRLTQEDGHQAWSSPIYVIAG